MYALVLLTVCYWCPVYPIYPVVPVQPAPIAVPVQLVAPVVSPVQYPTPLRNFLFGRYRLHWVSVMPVQQQVQPGASK